MLRHLAVVAMSTILLPLAATPCEAQRVWVGDGAVRVRAPFVSVDVVPYGGVSVRAPFAAVDVPLRGYEGPPMGDYDDHAYHAEVFAQPRAAETAFPSAAELRGMTSEQLNITLQDLSQRLHIRLQRFDTGQTWQNYLQLSPESIDPATPADKRAADLIELLERFHKIAADPQYPMIARLPEFQAMEAAVNEAVNRPEHPAESSAPAVEELPMPAPAQPVPAENEDPFLQPTPPQ